MFRVLGQSNWHTPKPSPNTRDHPCVCLPFPRQLPTMAAFRNICLLLWRNYVKRRRSLCSFCCELFFPIIIVALFIALYQAFSRTNRPDKMYFDNWSTVSPLAGVGYRFANASQRLALGKRVPL